MVRNEEHRVEIREKGGMMMKKPKMILFDYGQTLVHEQKFDGLRGVAAVMEYAVVNKHNKTPKDIFELSKELNREIGRFDPATRHTFQIEIPSEQFDAYLYESQGIRLSITYEEAGKVYWDAGGSGVPTNGIAEFLEFLNQHGIRSGVVSNLSFSERALRERIDTLIPSNNFEFIVSTCEYVFRKPNRHIFELALEKAELNADEVWFVGDQYKCDIVGAKNAGMTPFWYKEYIRYEDENEDGVTVINNWNELKNIILSLE